MQLQNGMTLRSKLLAAVIVPFVGLTLIAIDGLVSRIAEWRAMSAAETVTEFSITVSDFMRDSRVERGQSVLFATTRGAQGAREMASARKRVDEKRDDLKTKLTDLADEANAGLVRKVREALKGLEQVDIIRGQVDKLKSSPQEVLERYTALHTLLMRVKQRQIEAISDPELAAVLRGQSSIDHIQELLGVQRAVLSEVFARDRRKPEDLRKLLAAIKDQALHEETFLFYAADASIRTFKDTNRASCAMDADAMRSSVLNPAAAGPYSVDPQIWFEQSSCQINGLREVATRQLAELAAMVDDKRTGVQWTIGIFLAVVILGGLVSIWLALSIIRAITHQITELTSGMRAFGAGDLESRVTVVSNDELGQLAEEYNDLAGKVWIATTEMQEMAERETRAAALLREMLGKALVFIESVSKGDLTRTISLEGGEDMEMLGKALNDMTSDLARITRQTTAASNTMSSSTNELKAAVAAQSSGASEQAAAVSETTVTLEEIKATSTQMLDNAQKLGEVAERTRQEGEQGVEAVEEAISGIEAIRERMDGIAQTILALSEQTQQIGDITTVVSNIAQQSKMLSLNASIEAAKAGDAGQGFAVVASEVRALAEQSQQSTAQVQQILQDIRHATDRAVMATEEGSKDVDTGVELARRSSEAIKQLSDVIRETSLASQKIVAAVRQEAIGIDQVTSAMNEINKVTAQFVAGTKQSQAAAEALTTVASELQTSVATYKL